MDLRVEHLCLNEAVLVYRGIHFIGPLKVLYTSTLADLFIPTPSRLLWEAFSHVAITADLNINTGPAPF